MINGLVPGEDLEKTIKGNQAIVFTTHSYIFPLFSHVNSHGRGPHKRTSMRDWKRMSKVHMR